VITLTLHSSQPPTLILGALRAHAGEWRQSHIPDELRQAGILAVECKVTRNSCTLAYRRRWYGAVERAARLRLRAEIDPDAQGGTTVRVWVSREAQWRLAALGVFLFMVVAVALLRFSIWPVVGVALGVTGLNYALVRDANRGLTRRSEPEADYLVRRIEDAVAAADGGGAVAPAS
jgi:hypothetical protein